MQIHPYVGPHWKEEIHRLSPQKNKNFMPSAKLSMCRGLIAVDSMGRVLVSLVALDWTPVPGLGGTDTNLCPFAAAGWGHAEPCAAGAAGSCRAGTCSASLHCATYQVPESSHEIYFAFPLPLDS